MITTIRQVLRRRRALKDIEASLANNSLQMLNKIDNSDDEIIGLILQAAQATLLMSERDRRKPQFAFSELYASVKNASCGERTFMKFYCLYYLAVLRGAYSDCFTHASSAYKMPNMKHLRKALRMPAPVERNMIGTFVTATQ